MSRMRVISSHRARWSLGALAVVVTVFLALSGTVSAQLPLPSPLPLPGTGTTGSQSVTGTAAAIQATVFGTTTVLASTGNLVNESDALDASALTGQVPSVGGAEVLSAAAISNILGRDAGDNVASEASLANLALTVLGVPMSADFVMARASFVIGGANIAQSDLAGLTLNGLPVAVDGSQNQTISLPGLAVIVNEVQQSAGGVTVNALHIKSLDGLVDIVIASATAGIQ